MTMFTTPTSRSITSSRGNSRRRGIAMVMVMLALAVGTIITLTFLSSQTTSMAIAHNATRQIQARAIAEDAVDLAMEYIRADTDWRDNHTHGTWSADQALNGGTFRVMFEDADDTDLGDDLSEAFTMTVEAGFDGVTHRTQTLVTPRGSAAAQDIKVLLVVPSAGSLNGDDTARQALLTSWGYEVQLISHSASSNEFQDAFSSNDVVYVSENASASSVADDLPAATIGVVFEQGGLTDDLGLSSSYFNYSASYITVIDNSHPITEDFGLGHVFVTDSRTNLLAITGTKASGLQALAASDYGTSYTKLGAVEAGESLYGGGSAAARRVSLPWGGSSFDFDLLSSDGKKILKKSLIWAGADPGPAAPDTRWPLDETSGTTAADTLGSNDGTYTLSPTLGEPGVKANAIQLDDTLDRVTLPTATLDGKNDYSFAIWFKTAKTGQQSIISGARSNSNNAQLIFLSNSTTIHLYDPSASGGRTSWSITSVADDEWHHLVLVRDGTNGRATMYLDGVSEGTNSVNFVPVSIEHLVLGEEQDRVDGGYQTSQSFVGSLDDAHVFDKALSAGEVAALYEGVANSGEGPGLVALYEFIEPTPVTPTLVGHWKLDETGAGFVEAGGQVVMEAENYTASQAGTGSGGNDTWGGTTDNSPSGVAMVAGPNNGHNMALTTNGARLDYQIGFTTPGTYRVWVRTLGASGGDDSIHVGLDGTCLTNASGYGLGNSSGSWAWVDDVAGGSSNISLNIPAAGTYTFNVWMREDGTLIDKIVLNTSASQPSGTGPAESELAGAATDEIGASDGSYESDPALGQAGHGDGGVAPNFDGTDDFVEVPHDDAYLLDEGTVSFWFYADSVSGTQGLVGKDATNYGTGGHFRVYLNGSRLECRLQSRSYSNYVYSSSGAVSTGRWHHVAVGFGGQGLRLYLDGAQVDAHHYYGGLGTSSGGSGNHEPWAFGVDLWRSDSLSTDGWEYPFDGRIDDVRLYDMNLDTSQVGDLVAGDPPGSAARATVEDTADAGTALDLTIADPDHITWIAGGGLTIDTATTIASPGTVPRLHGNLTDTHQMTLEAEFTPANLTQDGPARIVTYSNGSSSRNFHLGQTDAKYNARLRTEYNTSGTPEAESGDVLLADTRQHVIVTYNGEDLKLFRNGTLEITEPWTGDLSNWSSAYQLVLGNEVGGGRDWLGTLHRVAIWDRAVNTVQADNLFNGDDPGPPDGGDEGLSYVVEWLENP